MYVTSANECYALDAGNGREIWRFQQPRTKGLVGNAAGGINRGVAVSGERVFMVTDHAHLLALNRFTGELLWDTEMADWRQNYNATSAPLIVGDFVVAGTGRRRAGRTRVSRGVRSDHRKGSVAVLDGAEAGRAGIGDMEGRRHRTARRHNVDDRRLRCRARSGVLDDRQSKSRLQRRRAAWRQSVRELRRRARRAKRPPEVALSVHAAQRMGLGRAAADRAHRRDVGRTAAKASRSGQPEWVLLRPRSHRRHVSARKAIRQSPDVGARDRR